MKGPILCFVGPPGRRQDLARPLDRARPRPQVRAPLARRRPRRGRDPRPPPHLRRRDARAHHPGDPPGRHVEPRLHARRDRQDRRRLPRRSRRRRCSRCSIRSRTTTFRDHYLGVPFDLSKRAVHRDGQRARPDPAGLPRPHGGHPPLRLHGEEEKLRSPGATSSRSRSRRTASPTANIEFTDSGHREGHRGLHARSRACATSSARSARSAARSPSRSPKGKQRRYRITPASRREDARADRSTSREEQLKKDEVGVATGLAWTSVGGDILFIEALAVRGKGGLRLTGQLGDVMKESAQAALSYARAHAVGARASRTTTSRPTTSTSTCPRARSRRTARRPASRWPRR